MYLKLDEIQRKGFEHINLLECSNFFISPFKSIKNYKSIVGYFNISDKKTSITKELKPEIRVYDKPITITYEASIESNLFSDTYLTMSNISETDVFNIKFQVKPFMNFIWFSVLLLSLGGLLNFLSRNKNEKN